MDYLDDKMIDAAGRDLLGMLAERYGLHLKDQGYGTLDAGETRRAAPASFASGNVAVQVKRDRTADVLTVWIDADGVPSGSYASAVDLNMYDVPGIYDALRRALGTGGWWAVQAVHDGTDLTLVEVPEGEGGAPYAEALADAQDQARAAGPNCRIYTFA